jgi:predicted RNA-binding protein with PUA-like domain
MSRQHFLVKSEPFKYAFAQLVAEGRAVWDGVRNYEARNNLRSMREGDLLLFYHSNEGKAVVGVAKVAREAYPDPTAPGEDWSVVDVEPVCPLVEAVTLDQIRADPALSELALLKRSRLSVVPVSGAHFERILAMGRTALPTAGPKARKPSKKDTGRGAKSAKG